MPSTQPHLGNSQSGRAWDRVTFCHLGWSLGYCCTPLDLTKPFQCFPVPNSELTSLQFSSVAASSHCHFPSFGDTACVKLAFENVNKGFSLLGLLSSLLSFLGRHCQCPSWHLVDFLSSSPSNNINVALWLSISQFIIFNLCLLRFIYVVVFLRSWSLIETNLIQGPQPEFLANK